MYCVFGLVMSYKNIKILDLLSSCKICPRKCGVNRLKDEKGFCQAGTEIKIYNLHLHHGEEPIISGTKGSGTIFFSHCNSRCVFCQNYMFSQLGEGVENSIDFLADAMLGLQNKGAHNINLVTPTHYSIQIIQAVKIAKEKGLKIPIVYNTNGYELSEMIDLLNGIVDIYLPDMKYNSEESAVKYSSMPGYVSYNRASVKRMYEQVGELVCEDGIAKRGIIIRHLILPNGLSGTRGIMEFISRELSPNVHMSLMSQYYPVYNASVHPEINRQITKNEYEEAIDAMEQYGLENGWIQDAPSDDDRNTFLGENFNLNI